MQKITSAQFKQAVELDPAWASKLTEPVEITDFCDMTESNISHLSPLLHFVGRNEEGHTAILRAAHFNGCYNLKVAEETFPGYVDFNQSNVEIIKNLKITSTSTEDC